MYFNKKTDFILYNIWNKGQTDETLKQQRLIKMKCIEIISSLHNMLKCVMLIASAKTPPEK